MVTRLLTHPRVAPALVLGALGWGALTVGLLLAGPGLGAWADTLLVACFGWSAEARRYRLDALLLALLQPPLFVATVGLFYGDELRAWLHTRAGRLAAAVGAALFLGPAAWLLLHVEVTATGLPPAAAALAAPIRQGAPGPAFSLVDHRGTPVSADSLRGRPVVLTFVYASCHGTCPALVARLRALEARYPAPARFVAVTLDPERDTPEALAAQAARWGLGPAWHLLTGDPAAVQRLAAAHGVHAVRLPDGEIAHDNVVILLDRAGRVAFTYRGLAHPQARLATALGQLIDERGGT
ncbi:MAG TPA: SCO family protein [Methylomirabilota bacterium]|jgi:protein SCO1/2|nr:SCO family protein [Methylomirabilota bacterium]